MRDELPAGRDELPAGTIAALAGFPVKSMLGEDLEEVVVTPAGVAGDRAYALVDCADGLVASAKNPRKWGGLLRLRAELVDEPQPGRPAPPVVISGDDGVIGRSDQSAIHGALSRVVGREVRLADVAPEERRFEEVWPDVHGLAPQAFIDRTRVAVQPTGESVSEMALATAAPRWGVWACAGLYADARDGGRVCLGDPVVVAPPAA